MSKNRIMLETKLTIITLKSNKKCINNTEVNIDQSQEEWKC